MFLKFSTFRWYITYIHLLKKVIKKTPLNDKKNAFFLAATVKLYVNGQKKKVTFNRFTMIYFFIFKGFYTGLDRTVLDCQTIVSTVIVA